MTYDTVNLGDWTQTAAAMYVWWVHFHKPNTFKQFIEECVTQSRMNEYPVTWINRDQIGSSVKPDGIDQVIMICNGWWMHKKGTYQFITPDWLVPIYTSMHFTDAGIITPDVRDHLVRYQPIGCRDSSTMKLLCSLGIDAYFSGCLTMTMNMRDPAFGFVCSEDFSANDIYIDILLRMNIQPLATMIKRTQHHTEPNDLKNINRIVQATYNYMFAVRVVTARLHVWLPLACNGANVVLMSKHTNQPFKNGDADNESEKINRFAGLTEVVYNKDGFDMFRKGLLTDTLEKILQVL